MRLHETTSKFIIHVTSPFLPKLAIVLLGRVPEFEVEALLEFTNLVIKSLKNPLLKHLVFEEPELGRQELGKLDVRKPRVGKPEVDKQEREEN
nr:hypothetical protein [Tanacetum cinerariifolium]